MRTVLVKIQDGKYYRDSGSAGRNKIPLIQIEAQNIKNVAIEVFDAGKLPQAVTDERAPETLAEPVADNPPSSEPLKAARPRRRAEPAKPEKRATE
jgi:hypothetical protein